MTSDMILTQDLSKQFGDFTAVDSVNLKVNTGTVLVILGPNGAGKTTTIRMLTSVLRPTRGTAWVAGFNVVEEPQKVRSSVGVLTEHHGLYTRMNADEYLTFFGALYGLDSASVDRRIGDLLDSFGLLENRKQKLGEFSKGMRQKLALVRAMLNDPPVLLLDEPTSAMDPESARVVRDAIKTMRSSERTFVLCTHNLAEAEELADQIAIIRLGKIIYTGSLDSLKKVVLGIPEYIVRFSAPLDGRKIHLPKGIELSNSGNDWLQVRVDNPLHDNTALLRYILNELNLPVVTFQEVPRSLEQVYLTAMERAAREEVDARTA